MPILKDYLRRTYSFMELRKTVGWIGVSLPFVLMFGAHLIFNEELIQKSISHYYYTGMRDVFVGGLCAISLFMFFYVGDDKRHNIAGNVVGFSAIGIAWFPTTEAGPADSIGIFHYIFSIVFFLSLSVFSICLFRKNKKGEESISHKKNITYIICGIIMIISLAGIAIYLNFIQDENHRSGFIFFAETVALLAFGFSWLAKGEATFNQLMPRRIFNCIKRFIK